MDSALPLTPRLLGPRPDGLTFLLLGNCQIEYLVPQAERFGVNVRHMLYGSHAVLPDLDVSQIDAAGVGLTLRQIISDASGKPFGPSDLYLARVHDAEESETLLENCAEIIRSRLELLHGALKAVPTFFLAFLEPSFNYIGNLMDRYDPTSPWMFVRLLNCRLCQMMRNFPNFYFVDANELINFIGRMHLQDDVSASHSHASFISDWDLDNDKDRLIPAISKFTTYETWSHIPAYGEAFWNLIADNLTILRQTTSVKLIIVDLDDTLWRGVPAEETAENWFRIEGWPLGFVEALLFFKRRGGLLAICSKNDHGPTIERLANIWNGAITIDDFASVKINWNSKSSNIAEILAETNLLPENVVFVDDNPRELDEVKVQFPALRCLGGNHYDWRRIILRAPETQVPFISDESSQRTGLVQARVQRESIAKHVPRDQWLKSLALEESYHLVNSSESDLFRRAHELINKTNQFNTTGRRWQIHELETFFKMGGVCLLASLKDRNVNNGIIGAVLIARGELLQAVLSCRVFNLGAEICLGRAATLLALTQAKKASGRIIDTGKNFACHKYFEHLGFQRNGDCFEATRACAAPAWIKESPIPGVPDVLLSAAETGSE